MGRRSLITFAVSLIVPMLFLTFVRCARINWICEVEVPLLTLIFPYAVVSVFPFPETNVLFYCLAIAQFPVYSAVWYLARKKTRFRWPGLVLVGFHIAVVVLAFVVVASLVH